MKGPWLIRSATVAFNEAKLQDLVAQCQRNNERLGVTGILVYSDGNFMQVIEGADLVTHIQLAGSGSGTHHKVTLNDARTEATGTAANGEPFKCIKGKMAS